MPIERILGCAESAVSVEQMVQYPAGGIRVSDTCRYLINLALAVMRDALRQKRYHTKLTVSQNNELCQIHLATLRGRGLESAGGRTREVFCTGNWTQANTMGRQ